MGRVSGGMQDISGTTGYLRFSTNDGSSLNEVARFDKNGNFGINISSPTNKFHLIDNGSDPMRIEGLNNAQTNDTSVLVTNPTSGVVRHISINSIGNDHDWYTANTTSQPASINDNIFTQGNVGINLNNPTKNLEINGLMRDNVFETFSNSSFNQFNFRPANGGARFTNWSIYNNGAGSIKPGSLNFWTGSASAILIDSNRFVGLNNINPQNRLHITPTGGQDPLRLDGLNNAQTNDTAVLVTNPSDGVVRYRSIETIGTIDDVEHLRDDTLSVTQGSNIYKVDLANTMAEIYDVSGGYALTGSFTVIPFGTNGIVDNNYTAANDRITVAKTGRYKITYRVSVEMVGGNNRSESEFQLTRNNVVWP